jgi:SAM-dependent methyltransferase
MIDTTSLERIVPENLDEAGTTGKSTLEFHLERYRFAARYLGSGRLLDIACGVGYGTHHLVSECMQLTSALGVDLCPAAIEYAREHYYAANLRFVEADAMEFTTDVGFDNIVSLETIEHLPEPKRFFGKVANMLTIGGILVGSVPVTPSMDGNPHHLSDFTEASFRGLGRENGLREIASLRQVQPFSAVSVVNGTESRAIRSGSELLKFYSQHPSKLGARLWSTLRFGFTNRYLTVIWTK